MLKKNFTVHDFCNFSLIYILDHITAKPEREICKIAKNLPSNLSNMRGSAVLDSVHEDAHQELMLLVKNKLFGADRIMLAPELNYITAVLILCAEELCEYFMVTRLILCSD